VKATSAAEAVADLAADPTLLAEARRALPALEVDARQPSGRAGVMRVISKRFALYPQASRSEGEWSAWWAEYLAVLEGLPETALEAGMAAWVAKPTSRFLPMPGQLRDLALTVPNPSAQAFSRARAALLRADQAPAGPVGGLPPVEAALKPFPEPRRASPEERERVRRMADDFARQAAAREAPE
jgi:hypothetical protein